jgi:hypothetical protein
MLSASSVPKADKKGAGNKSLAAISQHGRRGPEEQKHKPGDECQRIDSLDRQAVEVNVELEAENG